MPHLITSEDLDLFNKVVEAEAEYEEGCLAYEEYHDVMFLAARRWDEDRTYDADDDGEVYDIAAEFCQAVRDHKAKTTAEVAMTTAQKWKLLEKIIADPETERLMLYGPPGTGKTRLATMGKPAHKNQRVFNVILTEESASAELRGHYVPKGDIWEFVYMPAINAWCEAGRLVINEINNASGDVLDFLLVILDDHEVAQLMLPNGDVVRPKPGFQCFATMNGELDDLPPALRNRFVEKMKLMEPHPDAIARLPEDVRGAFTAQAAGRSEDMMSIRSWLAFDRLRSKGLVTEAEAALLVFEANANSVIEALTISRGGLKYGEKPKPVKPAASTTVTLKKPTATKPATKPKPVVKPVPPTEEA